MSKVTYDSIIKYLRQSKKSIVCDDVIRYLTKLGYEVTKRSGGKHFTYDHPKLDWHGSNFDCGHGRNPQVLPCYIDKIIKILEAHKDEFDEPGKESEND
jgi:hypothetical protein